MKYIYIIILFVTGSIYSQTQYQAELNIGTGFQSNIEFNDSEISQNTLAIRLGANVQIPIYKKFYIETGVFGKFNYGTTELEILKIKSNSLRLQVPLYVGYKMDDKWKFSLGSSIENNRDFKDFNNNKEYNIRFDFLTKVVYHYKEEIHFVFYSNWTISDIQIFMV